MSLKVEDRFGFVGDSVFIHELFVFISHIWFHLEGRSGRKQATSSRRVGAPADTVTTGQCLEVVADELARGEAREKIGG